MVGADKAYFRQFAVISLRGALKFTDVALAAAKQLWIQVQNAVELGTGAHEKLIQPALQDKVAVHAAAGRAPAAGLDGHQQNAPSIPLQCNQGIKMRAVGRAVRTGLQKPHEVYTHVQ